MPRTTQAGRNKEGRHVRCTRGAALHRLQNLADRLAVVIGGALGRPDLVDVGGRRRAAESAARRAGRRFPGGKVFIDGRRATRGAAAILAREAAFCIAAAIEANGSAPDAVGGTDSVLRPADANRWIVRRLRASWIADIAASVGS